MSRHGEFRDFFNSDFRMVHPYDYTNDGSLCTLVVSRTKMYETLLVSIRIKT